MILSYAVLESALARALIGYRYLRLSTDMAMIESNRIVGVKEIVYISNISVDLHIWIRRISRNLLKTPHVRKAKVGSFTLHFSSLAPSNNIYN